MGNIQELGDTRLTEIARDTLDVRFGSVCAWSDGLSESDYRYALGKIREGRYLEQALDHVPGKMWGRSRNHHRGWIFRGAGGRISRSK